MELDHIDLLYFHQFDDDTDPEESLMAMEDLIKQDLVRYFAVSNFSVEQLAFLSTPLTLVVQSCH